MGELRQRGKVWWIRYYREGRRYEEAPEAADCQRRGRCSSKRRGTSRTVSPCAWAMGRLRFGDAAKDIEAEFHRQRAEVAAQSEVSGSSCISSPTSAAGA